MTFSQAVRQAPVEPGRQKMSVRLAIPATARDWMVDMPISCKDTARNTSPKPGMVLSNRISTASGVMSRSNMPVPPVINTMSVCGSAMAAETMARMS